MRITNFFIISVMISGVLFAQPGRWDKEDEDRGRMEMYAIWKLTETLNLDEKQAEVFFPKLNAHKDKMRGIQRDRRGNWKDIVAKAKKGEEISDNELQEVLNKDKFIEKKFISEKEKFSKGLNDVLNNEQIVLYHVFGREMLGEAKERMRDQRKRGKNMGGFKGKRKRW
ncbi:MAG: hypothetical protein CMF92_00130 [Candidatus Marinimicrobia bacterium]|nr:hypothetical protein [Candidatus Neomarinimicrobiota bacterium]